MSSEVIFFMKKIKAISVSLICMTIITVVLLSITSFIVTKIGVLPKTSLSMITTLIGCIAVFLGAAILSLLTKEKGIVYGLICAVVLIVVSLIISFFILKAEFTISTIGKIAAILLSGAIGGIIGVNRKNKVKF